METEGTVKRFWYKRHDSKHKTQKHTKKIVHKKKNKIKYEKNEAKRRQSTVNKLRYTLP